MNIQSDSIVYKRKPKQKIRNTLYETSVRIAGIWTKIWNWDHSYYVLPT
jgi:hypothetical protein